MQDEYYPVENGQPVIPPEEKTAPAAAPAAVPAAAPVPKYALAKKAYSKVGLAVLFLFLAMQVIGTVIQMVGILRLVIPAVLEESLRNPQDFLADFGEIYRKVMNMILQEMSSGLTPYMLIGTVVGLAAAILIAGGILRKTPAARIPRRRLSGKEYFFMLAVSLGLWGVGAVIGNLPSICGLVNPLDSLMSGEGLWGALLTLYAMFGAPVLEELAFRKLLLDRLQPYGEVPAAFLSALLFGMFHGNSAQFILAFMVGLAFAAVYLKTGNVWYSISFHMVINTVASLGELVSILTGKTELLGMDLEWLRMGLIALLGVIGTVIAVSKRRSPLLALKRPDYLNCNRVMFRNAGFIIFTVMISLTVVEMDAAMFVTNFLVPEEIFGGMEIHPLAFLSFLPTVLYFGSLIAIIKTVGKHSDMMTTAAEYVPDGADANKIP